MKPPIHPVLSHAQFRTAMIALILLTVLAPAQAFRKDALNIKVQSSVEDRELKGWGKAPLKSHGKVYFLAPPLLKPAPLRLVKPVDPKTIEAAVQKVLQAKGYHRAIMGETPDVTITVLYGRGLIHNPYPSPTPGLRWTVREAVKLSNAGFIPFSGIIERKRQLAFHEKLAIVVAAWAWDPPAMKKRKAKLLWRTMVYIDDPAHRDLNNIADKMLAVAADYFDRETDVPEVEVTKPLPEGHVEIGSGKVIEQPAKVEK